MFSKYHYLDHSLSTRSINYCVILKDKIVGFIGVIHLSHSTYGLTYRVHRLVVLPDYQGIGIGKFLLNTVASKFYETNKHFYLASSSKSMLEALKKDKNWILKNKRIGTFTTSKSPSFARKNTKKTMRAGMILFTFKYFPKID